MLPLAYDYKDMKTILYIHGMGGGSDSRIPSILAEALPYKVVCRTYSFDPEEAAEQIFSLRRARLDLVSGEFGDGVFGGGLESALKEIDRLEREYLELFYGKRSITTLAERFILPVNSEQPSTVIARFSAESGIVAKDDLSGDIILVKITPSEMTYPQSELKGTVAYRYANNAEVIVALGGDLLARNILPLYEFGETVMFLQPR